MNCKRTIRKKILTERRTFNEYKFHNENELIIGNVSIILKSLYKKILTGEKKNLHFKNHNVEICNTEQSVGLYLPIKGEPDLTKIMLYNSCWTFALPKIEDNRMRFVHYQIGAKLEKKTHYLMQPESNVQINPAIIIAPALAYSQQGYRLGFGSGHYDRYFSQQEEVANQHIIKIGVCFDKYLLESLPNENHDTKFNYIVTEEMILRL